MAEQQDFNVAVETLVEAINTLTKEVERLRHSSIPTLTKQVESLGNSIDQLAQALKAQRSQRNITDSG